ncbi:MAG: LytR C-terminal domain-containing protein [Micrococcus sp.]|nr:LytR C-terminal domain-containing protein [Micrococcus sp.]
MSTPRKTSGRPRGGRRAQDPPRKDPRLDDDGRQIFTEEDLEGYFGAVDPRALARDRRRRRWRHGIVLGLVALLLLGLTVSAVQVLRGQWAIPGWEASPPREPLLCPAETFAYAKDAPVMVYNGTTLDGLAGDVANDLERRRFVIDGVGNKGFATANMVAVIISGEAGRDTAFALQRNIEGSIYRPDWRVEDTVDVIVGTKYKGLVQAAAVDTRPGTLYCQRLETETPTSAPG